MEKGDRKMKYSKEELLNMYYHLARGRVFTLKMHECVQAGYIRSSFHTPYGEEAASVGVLTAMRDTDWYGTTHRTQPAAIMRYDIYQYISEIFGKADGMFKGSTFDIHTSDYGKGKMPAPVGTLSSSLGNHVGIAWMEKRNGTDNIFVASGGDGGWSEGICWELLNISALYAIPIVFIVNDNGWAMTVPVERQTFNRDFAQKAEAFGVKAFKADGTDILSVREAADAAIAYTRNESKPSFIHMTSLRWEAHFIGQGDDYRNDKELVKEAKEKRDCLKNYEKYLLDNGICDQAYMDKIKDDFAAELDEMIARAVAAPLPNVSEVFKKEYIYATPETGGDL